MSADETIDELYARLQEIVDDGDTPINYGNRICRAIALLTATTAKLTSETEAREKAERERDDSHAALTGKEKG